MEVKEWQKWERQKIDYISFEEQGLDIEPTIYEGYAARQTEQKGKVSATLQLS